MGLGEKRILGCAHPEAACLSTFEACAPQAPCPPNVLTAGATPGVSEGDLRAGLWSQTCGILTEPRPLKP